MEKKSNEARGLQKLVDKFLLNGDTDAYMKLMHLLENGIKNVLYDELKGKNFPHPEIVVENAYDDTIYDVIKYVKDYYDQSKGSFTTWVYAVAKRNLSKLTKQYIDSGINIVSSDVLDIDSKNSENDSESLKYIISREEPEREYTYCINGVYKTCTISEMMDDITMCLKSCIYYMKPKSVERKRYQDILRMLYIEKRTMQETADIVGVGLHTVKNAVTFTKDEIMKIFQDKYSELYNIIVTNRLFEKADSLKNKIVA